jgi:dTDP-glucose pyrophosphorylase
VLAYEVEDPSTFGVFVTDEDGYLVRAVEKPKEYVSNLASTGAMVMDVDFFNAKVPPSARGEYEQPDVLQKLVRDYRKKIKVVPALHWSPVNDKDQLDEAHTALSERKARVS